MDRRSAATTNPSTGGANPFEMSRDILIPEIKYANILTHDAWGDAIGIAASGTTFPMLLSCEYSKGKLLVLTVPTDPADLYSLPSDILSVIRANLAANESVRIDSAPAQVSIFRYDNSTFILQNYSIHTRNRHPIDNGKRGGFARADR